MPEPAPLKIINQLLRLWFSEGAPNVGGKVDLLFRVQNHSRTILSYVLHTCALTSIALACAYTATVLTLPFFWGAILGAMFYLVLVLVVWD
ncbi:MAG TPA: hypothetical protein VJM12_10700 [Pyrinomonadaceae bacterium]|nr:hypothetical protein [Pyrinomonadaceae bacterium]